MSRDEAVSRDEASRITRARFSWPRPDPDATARRTRVVGPTGEHQVECSPRGEVAISAEHHYVTRQPRGATTEGRAWIPVATARYERGRLVALDRDDLAPGLVEAATIAAACALREADERLAERAVALAREAVDVADARRAIAKLL